MIAADFTVPDLLAKLHEHEQRIGQEVIVAMQTNRGMLFDAEGAYNGHDKWESLTLRAGQILANRGVLKKSLAPGTPSGEPGAGGVARIAGNVMTIGTNVAYAGLMNWGTTQMPDGVMRPTHAKALRIPIPGGKKATETAKGLRKKSNKTKDPGFMFVKYVKIPARRFDTITEQDQNDFQGAYAAAIAQVLNG